MRKVAVFVVGTSMLAGVAVADPGASDAESAIEATSLSGEPLERPNLDESVVARHEAAIADLAGRLLNHPDEAESRIWTGRHLGYLGRYREAIAIFSEGVKRHPDDARFPRHRGHRYLSIRKLDEAIADFEQGLAWVAGRPDRVEPDGLPNRFNRPTSSLKTNLWYHLGVARYVQHDFTRAAEAFLACAALAENDDMLIAAGYWRYLALRRAGRHARATDWLRSLPSEPRLIENDAYGRLIEIFRTGNVADEDEAADALAAATFGYGLGAWHFVEGRVEAAHAIWRRVLEGDSWSAFGYLAAEAEMATVSAKIPK